MHFISFLSIQVAAATSPTSPNGDFGEWNAFPGGQIPPSAQSADFGGNDLFGAMAAGPAPNPVSAPPAAPAFLDQFDLLGTSQSITSSQSLNVSMSSTQSMNTTVLPLSKSQVCLNSLPKTYYSTPKDPLQLAFVLLTYSL